MLVNFDNLSGSCECTWLPLFRYSNDENAAFVVAQRKSVFDFGSSLQHAIGVTRVTPAAGDLFHAVAFEKSS